MKFFCDLTKPIFQSEEVGGVKGNSIGYKYSIFADRMNWAVTKTYVNNGVDANPVGLRFYMGFKHLLPSLKEHNIIDPIKAIPNIIVTLEKLTKKKFTLKLNPNDSLESMGDSIDNFFKTNFLRLTHEGVFERIFGKDAKLK